MTCCSCTDRPAALADGAKAVSEHDAVALDLAARQSDDLEYGVVDVELLLPHGRFLDERANAAQNLAGALAILDDAWPRALRTSSKFGGVAASQRRPAPALVTTAAIG